jgi:hypothetical protein
MTDLFKKVLLASFLFCQQWSMAQDYSWASQGHSVNDGIVSHAKKLEVDRDGNIYQVLELFDTVQLGDKILQSQGGADIFLAKYNKQGILLDTISFCSSDYIFLGAFKLKEDRMYMSIMCRNEITINSQSYSGDGRDMSLLICMDLSLNIQWVRDGIIGQITAIEADDSGNVYFAGQYQVGSSFSDLNFPNPKTMWVSALQQWKTLTNLFIGKINLNVDLDWIRYGRTTGCCVAPMVSGLYLDQLNNLWMFGTVNATVIFDDWQAILSNNGNGYILKISENGSLLMDQAIVIDGSFADKAYLADIDGDASGNIFIFGSFYGVALKYENHVLINNSLGRSGFLMKLNNSGNLEWIREVETRLMFSNSLHTDPEGNAWIGGNFSEYFKFGSFELKDPRNLFIGKICTDGNLMFFASSRTSVYSSVDDLFALSGNEIVVTGTFKDSLELSCNRLFDRNYVPFLTRIFLPDYIDDLVIDGEEWVCENAGTMAIEATPSDNIYRYDWKISDSGNNRLVASTSAANRLSVHLDDYPGIYSFTSNVTASYNCSLFSIAQPFTTYLKNIPEPLYLEYGSDSICAEIEPVRIKAVSRHAENFEWSLSTGLTFEQTNDSLLGTSEINFIVPGNHDADSVKISVSASNSCLQSSLEHLTLYPAYPIEDLEYIEGPLVICPSISSLHYYTNLLNNTDYYQWLLPEEMTLSQPQPTGNHLNASYKLGNRHSGIIAVTAGNRCFTSNQMNVVVSFRNLLKEPVIQLSDCDLNILSSLSSGNIWYFNDVLIQDTLQVIRVSSPGEYHVKISNDCETRVSNKVTANPVSMEKIFVPNVFSPNGDVYNEYFDIGKELAGSVLQIYNRWGILVYEDPAYSNDWNSLDLSSGIYFYLIKNPCLDVPIKGQVTILR